MKRLFLTMFFGVFAFSITAQDIEEVVVTANKKEQTVQEIPMNITVISEQTLEDRGILTPEDYLRTLAGISTPGGSRFFTFRGLNTSTSQRASGTTSVFIDEINGGINNLFDIERVEVLRGPQGTLYGSNAIGGTIRYITNKPDSSAAYGKVMIGYGDKAKASDQIEKLNVMYNLPLTSDLALRAVYTSSVSPGIYKNIQTGQMTGEEEDTHIMLTLGFDDGGPLTGMIRYYQTVRDDFGIKEPGQDKPGNADVYVPNCLSSGTTASFWYNWDGQPTCARLAGIANEFGIALNSFDPQYSHALASDEIHETTVTTIVTHLKYAFETFNVDLIVHKKEFEEDYYTDWARIDMDDFVPAPLWVDDKDDESTTEEIRITSNPGPIEWTIGYYRYSFDGGSGVVETQYAIDAEWLDYVATIAGGLPSGSYTGAVYCPPYCEGSKGYPNLYYGSVTDYSYQDETSYYAQFDFNIADNLTLTTGIRDYKLSDSFGGREFGIFYIGNFGCPGTVDGPDGVNCSQESGTESDTRTKIALTYTPTEDLTLFTTQASGYRPGGNNSPLPYFCAQDPLAQKTFSRRYNSDDAETTEFGVKMRGSNYQFNATYFMVDWQGIIINVRPGCGWGFNFNGGEAETKGWEIDFAYSINDALALDFSGSVMSAETTIDIDSLGAKAGDRLPNSVEEQFNLGFVYDTSIMSYPAFARVDLNYYGDSFATFAENPLNSSPDYKKLNFNLGINISDSQVLQLSIDNLTDERTEAFIYAMEDTSWRPRNWMQWIPPRSVVLKYTLSF